MNVEIKKYLFDISESIDSIEKYLGDRRDFDVYLANKMLRREYGQRNQGQISPV